MHLHSAHHWLFLMIVLSAPVALADSEYRAFQSALGNAPAINANADHALAHTPFRPIPLQLEAEINGERLQLGFDLFHEPSLSRDGTVACNSCHTGSRGGSDGRVLAVGIGGALGDFNSPSTFNAVFNFRQFWDGRALDLSEQALGPIQNPVEMDHDLDLLVTQLRSDTRYAQRFVSVYGEPASAPNLADALSYFQRVRQIRPVSPFLRYLTGDEQALTAQELRGFDLFTSKGCVSCHNGINLGGNSYQKLGALVAFYDGDARLPRQADQGVLLRSERAHDRHVFKVPGLHNVAQTGPWLHDGSIAALAEVVEVMAHNQLNQSLSQAEIDDLVAFLGALSSEFGPGSGGGMGPGMGGGGGGGGGRMGPGGGTGAGMAGVTVQQAADAPVSSAAAPGQDHQAEYLAALATVGAAQQGIVEQMQALLTGKTEHFDFLQYEHLQMIRHARSLAHPPAILTPEQRSQIQVSSARILQQAEALEWVIADFLRAFAVPEAAVTRADSFVALVIEAPVATLTQEAAELFSQLVSTIGNGDVWQGRPFNGVLPDPALGLSYNNIGLLDLDGGKLYSCVRFLHDGEPGEFDGLARMDIIFDVLSGVELVLQVADVRPFNINNALNEASVLPDCSGSFELSTGIYSDTLQAGESVLLADFRLIDDQQLVFSIQSPAIWPAPFNGVSPDPALGLPVNNIGIVDLIGLRAYSCVSFQLHGEPGELDGIPRIDIIFAVLFDPIPALQVLDVRPFNQYGALNEAGELPACSGQFELSTGLYTDILEIGAEVLRAKFLLVDEHNLVLELLDSRAVGQ